MRIVYYAHSVLNRGGDKVVLAHLRHLADAGHSITIRANVVATQFALHPAFKLERPVLPGKIGSLAAALVQRERCDVVLAAIAPTAVLLRLRNPGRVLHFAQDDNETSCGFPGNLLMRWLYRAAFGVLSIPCICVSQGLAEHFGNRFGARCAVVENGLDPDRFHPQPDQALLDSKKGRPAILLLSRTDRRKGFDLAKETVARAAKHLDGGVEAWTVGEPPEWDVPNVPHRHFGFVGEPQLRGIMSSADLFLYPSRSEGYGLMALEAFACGCPVVTTEAVGFAADGRNALVSPVNDVSSLVGNVLRLLGDAELAARLREEGLRFARGRSQAASGVRFAEQLGNFFPGV